MHALAALNKFSIKLSLLKFFNVNVSAIVLCPLASCSKEDGGNVKRGSVGSFCF